MNGLILLADGFELVEAYTPVDILRRGQQGILTVSISSSLEVISNIGVKVLADTTLSQIDYRDFEFVILPGGLKGVNNLKNDTRVLDLLKYYNQNNKFIFAICAAPSILIGLNFLSNKVYSCYPGCDINTNGTNTLNPFTRSSQTILTAKSMYYSNDFGLEILEIIAGKEIRDDVENSIRGHKSK